MDNLNVILPAVDLDDRSLRAGEPSRCFACGALNPRGLHLHFRAGENGVVSARWRPSREFEGFPGVVHGGIVSTILDEAMSKAVASLGRQAFTCELRVRLRRHVEAGAPLTVRGWIVERRKRRVLAEAYLVTDAGEECARAWGTFLEAPLPRRPGQGAGRREPRP